MRVALVGRDPAKLEQTRAGLSRGAGRALVAPCDVADRGAVEAMVERVLAAFGAIDVLVCNAGTNVRNRSLEALDPADWDRMIATNLTGAFNLVHSVLPVDAGAAERPGDPDLLDLRQAGQRAGRGGLLGLEVRPGRARASAWAARKGPKGIRSTVIYPGEVNTPDPRRPPRPRRPGAPRGDPPARRRRRGRPLPRRAPPPGQRPRAGHQADRRRLLLNAIEGRLNG